MNCEFLTFPPSSDASVRAAIRITAPETVTRIPTHFILLIDVSESMLDERKLENVKRCSSLLLNFLKEDDTISLISFGEDAKLHLNHVSADEGNKATIKQAIQNLQCSGCTNLSAGLGYVRTVCEGQSQKTGLLLLQMATQIVVYLNQANFVDLWAQFVLYFPNSVSIVLHTAQITTKNLCGHLLKRTVAHIMSSVQLKTLPLHLAIHLVDS